jgi:hypothetical protein
LFTLNTLKLFFLLYFLENPSSSNSSLLKLKRIRGGISTSLAASRGKHPEREAEETKGWSDTNVWNNALIALYFCRQTTHPPPHCLFHSITLLYLMTNAMVERQVYL